MSNNNQLPTTISGRNKTPFILDGLTQSSMLFDSVLTASYDSSKSTLLNKNIYVINCGKSNDCKEYVDAFRKTKNSDKNSKTGCCVGLSAYFIKPDYDYDNTAYNSSSNLKILFKNKSDIELSSVIPFDIPNIYTISYLNEVIVSIIYDTNFENQKIEVYHPVIKSVKNSGLSITLPKTNGNVQNINL